jgi:hypothetical protein
MVGMAGDGIRGAAGEATVGGTVIMAEAGVGIAVGVGIAAGTTGDGGSETQARGAQIKRSEPPRRSPAPSLRQVVKDGPTPAIHGVVRWRFEPLRVVGLHKAVKVAVETAHRLAYGFRRRRAIAALTRGMLELRARSRRRCV